MIVQITGKLIDRLIINEYIDRHTYDKQMNIKYLARAIMNLREKHTFT